MRYLNSLLIQDKLLGNPEEKDICCNDLHYNVSFLQVPVRYDLPTLTSKSQTSLPTDAALLQTAMQILVPVLPAAKDFLI